MAPTRKTIEIKRYASRKLYNAEAKIYVTLDDIAGYIKDGAEVRIVDKQTGEDLTSQYLIQIIAERDSKGEGALPLEVLTDLVRMYHAQTSALTPSFLTDAVAAFQKHQEQLAAQPGNFLNAMQDWQAKQAEMFTSAMTAWSAPMKAGSQTPAPDPEYDDESGDADPPEDGSAPEEPGPSYESPEVPQDPVEANADASENEGAADQDNAREARVDALEAQLKRLQDELSRLK